MTIEYNISENDYLTHQLYTASKSARIKKKRQRGRVILPLMYGAFGLLLMWEGKSTSAIIFITLAVLWYFIYPLWDKRHYTRHYQAFIRENYKNRLGRTSTLEFDNDFIFAKDEGGESKVPTKEIEEINEIPTTIFIKLKTGHSFILPKDKIKNYDLLASRLKDLATHLNISYNVDDKWVWR